MTDQPTPRRPADAAAAGEADEPQDAAMNTTNRDRPGGDYACTCGICGHAFSGYKRDQICMACVGQIGSPLPPATPADAPSSPDRNWDAVFDEARKAVQPTIDRERANEYVSAETMNLRLDAMDQKQTFDWLLERHRKLLAIEERETAVPADAPGAAGGAGEPEDEELIRLLEEAGREKPRP